MLLEDTEGMPVSVQAFLDSIPPHPASFLFFLNFLQALTQKRGGMFSL
jgi:hypothetical protein